MQKSFPCSVALVSFCSRAFSCSVALVLCFWARHRLVQHGLSEGIQNIYKTNAFSTYFPQDSKQKSASGVAAKEQNLHKTFEINSLGRFGWTDFRGPTWTMKMQKSFPCSVALVSFCSGAFPCSVALVSCFWARLRVVQHGLSEGVRNRLK